MGRNKIPIETFSKLMDEFGENAAKETLDDVNSGRVGMEIVDVLEDYLFMDESKEEYLERIRKE